MKNYWEKNYGGGGGGGTTKGGGGMLALRVHTVLPIIILKINFPRNNRSPELYCVFKGDIEGRWIFLFSHTLLIGCVHVFFFKDTLLFFMFPLSSICLRIAEITNRVQERVGLENRWPSP